MAKKSHTKTVAKKSVSSPAQSSGKAKGAKARAAPLSIGVAKKTSPARTPLTNSRPVSGRTPAKPKPRSAMKRENSQQEKVDAGQTDQGLIGTIHHQNLRDILALASPASIKEPTEERITAVSSADGKKAEDLPLKENMAQEVTTKLFEENLRRIGAIRPPVSASGAAHQVAAVPRAGMAFSPLEMMMRQHAYGFNLMLDAWQIQRRFFDLWRPRLG